MNKHLIVSTLLIVSSIIASAFTLQENATPNTAMVIFFIIALVLALISIILGGSGQTQE